MPFIVDFSQAGVLQVNLAKAVEESSLEIAEMLAARIRNLAPVDEGNLKRSVKAIKSKFRNGGAIVVVGGGDEYYVSFLELGTKRKIAQPFIRPAIESIRHRAKRVIQRALQEKIK